MKTMVKEIQAYRYNELSDEAKGKVKAWYLDDDMLIDLFTEDCENYIHELFPVSELKISYSLSYCQGDYFNIYGTIYLDELLDRITKEYPNPFTAKEIKFFNHVFNRFGSSLHLKWGDWCTCKSADYIEDIVITLEDYDYRSIPYSTLDKFNEYAQDYMKRLCRKLSDNGYDFFYEVDEDTLDDYCESNDYWFDEDGNMVEE